MRLGHLIDDGKPKTCSLSGASSISPCERAHQVMYFCRWDSVPCVPYVDRDVPVPGLGAERDRRLAMPQCIRQQIVQRTKQGRFFHTDQDICWCHCHEGR